MPKIWRSLSFRNISAIYIFVAMFIIFSLWIPATFLNWGTWRSLLSSQAETGILAIGLVIALSANAFDLAIGAELGFASVVTAWLLVDVDVPVVLAIVLALVGGVLVGLVNGLLVVRFKINSFIATLGVSSILAAMTAWVSNSQEILGLPAGFVSIAGNTFLGIALPFWFMLIIGVAVWYVLEWTPLGRRVYATGGNINAARLAGVKVGAITVGALVGSGLLAAFAGVLVSANLEAADPTQGPAYLLPAFSAAFLGSTQFRGGRFNVWGTIVSVIVLATGVQGLQLAGVPTWIPNLFDGLALLFAVGLANFERTSARMDAIRRVLRLDRTGRRRKALNLDSASDNQLPAPVEDSLLPASSTSKHQI